MVKVEKYENIDQQQWQKLIEASATATWFQTDEAYRFYQSVGGMQAFAYGVAEVECKVESVKAGVCKPINLFNHTPIN